MKYALTACLAATLFCSVASYAAESTDKYMYPLLEAEFALGRQMPQVALQNYIAVAKETQDPKIAQRATEIALSIGGLEEAVEPAMVWAKNAPKDIEAQLTIILLLVKTQQESKTTPFFEALFKLNDPDMDKEFLGLYRQLENDVAEKAFVGELEKLHTNHPKEISLPLALAEISLFQGNLATTFKDAELALNIKPSLTRAMLMYGQAMLGLKGQEATLAYLETQVTQYPKDFTLRQFLIEILLEQGIAEKAKMQLNILAEQAELPPNTLLQLAKMSLDAGWAPEAKQLLLKAEKFPEQADSAHYLLAKLAQAQKNVKEAIDWYQQVNNGPFYILAQTEASHLLAESKQFDEASMLLSNLEPQTEADFKRIILAKAEVFDKAHQYSNGYAVLTQALENYPQEIDLLYARGLIADKFGKPQIAEADMKTILSIDPNHIDALNALGYILADKSDRYDEALKYISKALQIAPNNPAVMDSMGWLQFHLKHYDEAVKWLKQALELNPDPEIAAHLGEALWFARQKTQALEIWNQAIQDHPDDEMLLSTMKRLMPTSAGKVQ